MEFMQVEAGEKVSILSSTAQPIGGVWEADFGKVTPTGDYIAPTNIIAPGIDQIRHYASSNDVEPDFTLLVQFIPASHAPHPDAPTLDVVTNLEFEPAPYSPENFANSETAGDDVPVETIQVTEQATFSLSNEEAMQTVQVGNVTAYIPPVTYSTQSTVSGLLAVFNNSVNDRKRGKKCGVFPPPTGGCVNLSYYEVVGPYKFLRGPWKTDTKEFEVSSSISGKIGLGVGAKVSVTYEWRKVQRYRYKDMYVCRNGNWDYLGTDICRVEAIDYKNFIPYYGVWFFFPTDGQIHLYDGPEKCDTYRAP